MTEYARRVTLAITLDGHDVAGDFSPYLLDFSYRDNASGKADEIQITLYNRDGLFSGEWMPKKGMPIEASIVCTDWEEPGDIYELPCGRFSIDEIEFSGPPDKVSIKAVSADLTGPLRDSKKTRAWENMSLEALASQIASENGMELYYSGPEHRFERQDQRNEGDLAFLNRLCGERSMYCKAHQGKIVLFDCDGAESGEPVFTVHKTGGMYSPKTYSFRVSSAGTDYTDAEVTYCDPKTGTTHKAKVRSNKKSRNVAGTEKTMTVQKRVENPEQAVVLGKSELHAANAKERTSSLEIMGCPRIAAGQMLKLEDFGGFSGNYFIASATHKVSGAGLYSTSCELTTPAPTKAESAHEEKSEAAEAAKEEVAQAELDRKNEVVLYPPGQYPLSDEEEANIAGLRLRVEEAIRLAMSKPGLDYINLLHESVILCLSNIAKEEAKRRKKQDNIRDEIGFLYLSDMQRFWASGQKNDEAETSEKAIFVSWKWVYSYERVQEAYKHFVVINNNAPYTIFNKAAKKSLYDIIFNEVSYGETEAGKLKEKERKEIRAKILPKYVYDSGCNEKTFDFIHSSWQDWEYIYYAYKEVKGHSMFSIDGLTASFSTFTLRALASGYMKKIGEKWHVRVDKIAVFAHDKFNFAKSNELHNDFLGVWDCDNLTFSPVSLPSPVPGRWPLSNEIFRSFRDRYNVGRDFLVLSQLHIVESFTGNCYDYPL